MPPTVLETDIFSMLMRRHPIVTRRAASYLAEHARLTISVIAQYEILKGLKAKGATRQLAAFDQFCRGCEVAGLDDASVHAAAEIHAALKDRGRPGSDADILVAAVARSRGLTLATHNLRHFEAVPGLSIDDWAVEGAPSGPPTPGPPPQP